MRQYLRQSRARVAVRKPELLRDLADRSGAQDFLQLVTGHRQVLSAPYPRADFFGHAPVLELADDPGKSAVLLNELQRHLNQRALSLRSSPHQTTKQSVEQSH